MISFIVTIEHMTEQFQILFFLPNRVCYSTVQCSAVQYSREKGNGDDVGGGEGEDKSPLLFPILFLLLSSVPLIAL